jgi:hypothetical protein
MERALPSLRLGWTTSEKGDLIALEHRDEWVTGDRTDGGFPFLCNDDDNNAVTLTGWGGSTGPGKQTQLEVHARLPLNAAVALAAVDVLDAVAWGARAEQTAPTLEGPPCPPRGLPALRLPDKIRSSEIPHHLGWLNYWSEAAAQAIGFPDPVRDAELLSRARRTASGGWIVQLTEAPLELDNTTHLEALKRAYERFPQIGGRWAP